MNTQNMPLSKKAFVLVVSMFSIITLSAFYLQQNPWKAPATADTKKNPLISDAETIAAGKMVYVKECLSCHGKGGKGDGPSAAQLDKPAGNFTTAATQGQSDGALYWKVSEGKKPMPSLKKKLSETQIWQSVVYMRTFKK